MSWAAAKNSDSVTWIDDLPIPDPQVLLDDGVVPQQPAVPEHHNLLVLRCRRRRHHCSVAVGSQLRHLSFVQDCRFDVLILFSFDELLLLLIVGFSYTVDIGYEATRPVIKDTMRPLLMKPHFLVHTQ